MLRVALAVITRRGAHFPRSPKKNRFDTMAQKVHIVLEDDLDGARVVDWTRDPLALGGYAVFPVGSAGAAAALSRSVAGTLFFAGEATAGGLAGTVEGALQSGERAARELLAATAGRGAGRRAGRRGRS
jgi:monoamine oxidase